MIFHIWGKDGCTNEAEGEMVRMRGQLLFNFSAYPAKHANMQIVVKADVRVLTMVRNLLHSQSLSCDLPWCPPDTEAAVCQFNPVTLFKATAPPWFRGLTTLFLLSACPDPTTNR